MKNELIPPPGFEPQLSASLTSEQRIRAWMDLMDVGEQFLLAGLRRQIGEHGDLQRAYKEWYAKEMEAHDQMMIRLLEELNRRGRRHGR